ncbi:MAG: HTH-type transcriptional regulator, transcriptional repressor of biosynthesis s [Actinomycetota bacterium]|jgi:NadR type nicotinamide-nucleotide adenylyltransferase|nr:HTH-type transcriptional regulator, transcriptional repressor of biosynthesis s [Actinomycetota bacterium]
MTTGVVIGKFLPPHRGHKHLIDTAAAAVDHLTVLLCVRPDQPIDGATRARWLAEIHPDVDVVVVDDDIPDESAPWARRTAEVLGRAPDVVFSSESYGPRYAACLGARHVSVDPDRRRYPVSGTAVRADPAAHWAWLEPCVRAHYVRRVCVLGAESTGTTTLARALAERLDTIWVPEYGRRYCEDRAGGPWSSTEFVEIARRQQADEDAAARQSGPVLVCDTDALATAVWHERYLGRGSTVVDALAAARTYSLYVLTADDIPFVQDGTRDGEHLRRWMTERFRRRLAARPDPWIEVGGDHEHRLAAVLSALPA